MLQTVMSGYIFEYKSGITAKKFLPHLRSFLYEKIPFPANEAWLQKLCLKIEADLNLSTPEKEPLTSAKTQQDKLLTLFSIIESRGALCDTVWEASLNSIINNRYSTNDSYTAELRKAISQDQDLANYVTVKRKDLNRSPPVTKNNTEKEKAPFLGHIEAEERTRKQDKNKCQLAIVPCSLMATMTSFIALIIVVILQLQSIQNVSPSNITPSPPTVTNNNDSSHVPNQSSKGYGMNEDISAAELNKPDNNETSSTIAFNDTMQRANVTDQNVINMKIARYKVESCEDYKTVMTNPPQNKIIFMHIRLSSPYDWENCDINMNNAEKISKLSIGGPMTLADTFLKILNHTKNLEELRLSNTNGTFCDRNSGQLPTLTHLKVVGVQKVQLPRLHTLYMQDFTSCKEVFETLANHVSYGKLSRFAMRQCVYDEENQVQIEHLLETNRGSLKSVSLPATRWATTLASHNLDILGKVESLKIDFIPYLYSFHRSYLGTRFGRVFPNIVNFTSSAGYLPFDQLSDIFQLNRLESIQIGINVPEGNDQFDVSFLQNFPDMVKAEFFLEFQTCETGNRKKLVGLNTLSVKQSSLIILSNCRLFTPDENLNQRNEIFSKKGVYFVYKSLT